MIENQEIQRITSICGLDIQILLGKAKKLRMMMEKKRFVGLPLLIGFDINGPLVSTKDASMTPYKGVPDTLRFLSNIPNVKICLVTGWDITTVKMFASKLIRLPNINIISEKGMLYLKDNQIHHLYPHSESEIEDFAKTVFEIAAKKNLQIAIQGNTSSGCQCIYFEGYYRATLNAHPLMRGVTIESKTLLDVLTRYMIEYSMQGDIIKISATPEVVFNILKKELPLFPIRIIDGIKSKDGSHLFIKVDPKEDKNFGWDQLKETAKEISQRVSRSYDLNKDYSVDFTTFTAIDGGYSKDSAIHVLGHKLFNDNFIILNVGDKPGDSVEGDKALFFPQCDSEAMNVQSNVALPVIDGREYALIIALFLLRADKKEVSSS